MIRERFHVKCTKLCVPSAISVESTEGAQGGGGLVGGALGHVALVHDVRYTVSGRRASQLLARIGGKALTINS